MSTSDDRTLILLTSEYPFGIGESFLDGEVAALRTRFGTVTIIPTAPRRKLPASPADGGVLVPTRRVIAAAVAIEVGTHPLRLTRACVSVLRPPSLRRPRVRSITRVALGVYVGRLSRAINHSHIHAYWANAPATAAVIAGVVSGRPWSFTAHRADVVRDDSFAYKMESTRGVRAIGNISRDLLAAHLPLAAASKIRVIPLIVDPAIRKAPQSPAEDEVNSDVPPRLACIAALKPVKDHTTLFRCVAELAGVYPKIELDLFGAGDEEARLRKFADDLGITPNVRFLGHREHAEVLDALSSGRYTAVVQSSLQVGQLHEGVPVALAEAMVAGVSVVSTSSGGVSELLEGGLGEMVPCGDPHALADGVRRTLELSYEERRTRCDRASRHITATRGAESVVPRLLDLMQCQ